MTEKEIVERGVTYLSIDGKLIEVGGFISNLKLPLFSLEQ